MGGRGNRNPADSRINVRRGRGADNNSHHNSADTRKGGTLRSDYAVDKILERMYKLC